MNFRTPGIIAAFALCAAAFLAAAPLRAQTFTNPPCASVTVTNLNPLCNAQILLVTVPAFTWPGFFLAPGAAVALPVPLGGAVQVTGLVTPAGVTRPLRPPPSPFVWCGAGGWWARGVPLDPANPGCLFDVCVDPATCSITVQ